jgi:UDPglucose 6-dehydrogenase
MREAEMEKFVHNVYNAAKISFFNEMRWLCQDAGVSADAVFPLVCLSAEGMWNPAYGTRHGGPFEGKCLPKDTEALYRWAFENGRELALVHAVLDVNEDAGRLAGTLGASEPTRRG